MPRIPIETLGAGQGISPELREELMVQWMSDPKTAAYELFGDIFDVPFSTIHDQIIDLFFDYTKQKKLVLAPRGLGKTTLLRFRLMMDIIFANKRFIVYVSASETLAEMQTENMKRDLLTNKIIKKFCGNVKNDSYDYEVSKSAEIDESFSKKAWVAFGHTLILPRGCDQQIRGLNWNNFRPDLVALDDPEKPKELPNEEQRKKTKKWFLGDVTECVNRMRKDWEILYVDTLKHHDALPVHLQKMDSWDCHTFSICDENLNSLIPQLMSTEEIKEKYNEYLLDGSLDVFYREYMNKTMPPEIASFRAEHFNFYNESDGRLFQASGMAIPDRVNLERLETVILIDPAKTVTPQSDFSAMVVIGIDLENRRLFVRDIVNERMYPDELYDKFFELVDQYGVKVFGIELNSLNEFIDYPLQTEIAVRGYNFLDRIVLKPKMKKEDRIKTLVPYYRRGYVFHNKNTCAPLEMQLMDFPSSQYDDVADAFAYITQMLSEGNRLFLPAPSEKGTDIEHTDEDEYAGIYDEPALDIECRLVEV